MSGSTIGRTVIFFSIPILYVFPILLLLYLIDAWSLELIVPAMPIRYQSKIFEF